MIQEMIQGEQMYRVLYDFAYSSGTRREDEQVTQSRLDRMRELAKKGEYYSNIDVIEVLGHEDRTWWGTWYKIAMANQWIRMANDPPFKPDSFSECKSIARLIDQMERGNWCLGTAFTYRDLCFINQIEGGSEFRVIRKDIDFESWSTYDVLKGRNGRARFTETVNRMLAATDEQLRTGSYMDAGPIVHCAHCQGKLYPGESDIFKDAAADVCDSCYRGKKLYVRDAVEKVKRGERLTQDDLRFVQYKDKFVACGVKHTGMCIHWDKELAIALSYENDTVTLYCQGRIYFDPFRRVNFDPPIDELGISLATSS